jgi:hypothetical protein
VRPTVVSVDIDGGEVALHRDPAPLLRVEVIGDTTGVVPGGVDEG